MNLIQRIAARFAVRAAKFAGIQSSNAAAARYFTQLNWSSHSGTTVTEFTALNCSAVWAAVTTIADAVACLPVQLHQHSGGMVTLQRDHPVMRLHRAPNPEISGFTLRNVMQAHALTWGNAYAEIERDGAGRPLAMWPIPPNQVTPVRLKSGALGYLVRTSGGDVAIPAANMLHLAGPGFDGTQGYSVVSLARESIGLAIATEQHGSAFFGNGARPSGILTHPGALKKPARENLVKSWEDAHKGLDKSHRIALLEEGVTYTQIGIPPEDAQFLQTRQFQVVEIARWFKLPPHMLRDMSGANYNTLEQQGQELVNYTLWPWECRWSQEFDRKLLSESEQRDHCHSFNTDRLTRGDMATRYEAYSKALNDGWLCPDEVRAREGENPIADGSGQIYMRPLNHAQPQTEVDNNVAA